MKRRLWAWWLAVMIIATQVLGNTVSLARGHLLEGVTGILLAGALPFYLPRPKSAPPSLQPPPVPTPKH